MKKNLKGRIRKEGAGRKLKDVEYPELLGFIDQIMDTHRAGCPIKGQKWTYLNAREIATLLSAKGVEVCTKVVKRLLRKMNIGQRKLSKKQPMKDAENRNEQFIKVNSYKKYYLSHSYAVFSIDSKKKELLGPFYRDGKIYSQMEARCYDHDFPSFATGKIVSAGIDLAD